MSSRRSTPFLVAFGIVALGAVVALALRYDREPVIRLGPDGTPRRTGALLPIATGLALLATLLLPAGVAGGAAIQCSAFGQPLWTGCAVNGASATTAAARHSARPCSFTTPSTCPPR